MAENTLRNVYKLISDAFKKKKKKELKVDIGLGRTPQAKAIAKHKKDLEEALKY